MTLVPVKSSHVNAIGYSPEAELLRVEYLDGTTFDFPGVSASWHANLMASESKGRMLHELNGRGFKRSRITASDAGSGNSTADRDLHPPSPAVSADLHMCVAVCCGNFGRALSTGKTIGLESYECEKCDVQYEAVRISDTVIEWRPTTTPIEIFGIS